MQTLSWQVQNVGRYTSTLFPLVTSHILVSSREPITILIQIKFGDATPAMSQKRQSGGEDPMDSALCATPVDCTTPS